MAAFEVFTEDGGEHLFYQCALSIQTIELEEVGMSDTPPGIRLTAAC
jgi:hypothetical protein